MAFLWSNYAIYTILYTTMNKFSLLLFIGIVGVFVGIVYLTQQGSFKNVLSAQQTPSLPANANTLQLISQLPHQQDNQTVQPVTPTITQTFGVAEQPRASYSATIKTTKGDIVLTLDAQDAPNTVQNFITKAKSGYYNGLIFHRVEDWVIQGGDPKGNGTGGGLMQTELNQVPFTTGSLGMARGQNIQVSNDSQFFITKSDASWLNGQYTNFGQVTSGMDVVNKIQIGDKILGITVE